MRPATQNAPNSTSTLLRHNSIWLLQQQFRIAKKAYQTHTSWRVLVGKPGLLFRATAVLWNYVARILYHKYGRLSRGLGGIFKFGFVGVFRLARTPVGSDALVAPRTEKTNFFLSGHSPTQNEQNFIGIGATRASLPTAVLATQQPDKPQFASLIPPTQKREAFRPLFSLCATGFFISTYHPYRRPCRRLREPQPWARACRRPRTRWSG